MAPVHVTRLRNILAALDLGQGSEGMNLPGFRLHKLKGKTKGHWAVRLSGSRSVKFLYEGGVAGGANYLECHSGDGDMAKRNSPHPGGTVKRKCLDPLGLTVTWTAEGLDVTRQTLSELVDKRPGVSV